MIGNTNSSIIKNKIEQTSFLYRARWGQDKTYSFENEYNSANYDVEFEISSDATESQIEAYQTARIVSSSTLTNTCVAKGDVPTIDIPIILRITQK